MSNQRTTPEARTFTFVDYDINRRGVTDTARAHLMKDRVRSKREARSEWLLRNQFSPLRWMRPKEENPDLLDPGLSTARRVHSSESSRAVKASPSHYSTIIDFQNNPGSLAKPKYSDLSKPPALEKRSYCTRSRSLDRQEEISVSAETTLMDVRLREDPDSPLDLNDAWFPKGRDSDLILSSQKLAIIEGNDVYSAQNSTGQPKDTFRVDSEFGLSSIEGLRLDNTPLPVHSLTTDGLGRRSRKLLSELEKSAEAIPVHLLPSDGNLVRYFAVNAGSILGLDKFPEIEANYDPVSTLFLQFATSNRWCFETMVLLQSAYHHRRRVPLNERGTLYPENHYLAARQNVILAQTRARISALANRGDSSENDIVAFLFLAVSEYCWADRQIGRMHFQAWRDYCDMRKRFQLTSSGPQCKAVVWWCVSMLVEDDVALDSIIDPSTKARVREDPAKLFRYFLNTSSTDSATTSAGKLTPKLDRRRTS